MEALVSLADYYWHSIDPADGVEPVKIMKPGIRFNEELCYRTKKAALEDDKT